MSKETKIANAVIRRLPRYLRTLEEMEAAGQERTSSADLSEKIGFTASQIRQDLNHFGCFGQQGYGYSIKELKTEISRILGLKNKYKLVLIGCGRLGEAIANFTQNFESQFDIVAMFDTKPEKVGSVVCGLPVLEDKWIEEYVKKNRVDIGIITTPPECAQEVADKLKRGGVKGIWNFALCDIQNMDGVKVENTHLSDSLRALTYYISNK